MNHWTDNVAEALGFDGEGLDEGGRLAQAMEWLDTISLIEQTAKEIRQWVHKQPMTDLDKGDRQNLNKLYKLKAELFKIKRELGVPRW